MYWHKLGQQALQETHARSCRKKDTSSKQQTERNTHTHTHTHTHTERGG
eukprot:COSAG05_NODE_7191_length_844_cov_1.346309_1_plen_48_part_10